jgi:hypothetical protein
MGVHKTRDRRGLTLPPPAREGTTRLRVMGPTWVAVARASMRADPVQVD